MRYSLRNFEESAVVKQRMKIMRFYGTYGEKATKEAFGADRKVISRWKKRLTDNGGKLASLIPLPTRPNDLFFMLLDKYATFCVTQMEV